MISRTHTYTHILTNKFVLSPKSWKRRNFPKRKKTTSPHIRCAPVLTPEPQPQPTSSFILFYYTSIYFHFICCTTFPIIWHEHNKNQATTVTTTSPTSKPIAKLFNKLLLDRPAVTVYLCCGNCYSNFIC